MPLLSWEEKCTSTKFDYSLPDWQGFQEMILHAKVVLGDIWLQLFLDSKVLKESPSGPSDVMESRKEMVTICPRYSWLRTSHYIFYFPPRSKNFLGTICILITRSASQLSHFTNQTHFKVTHYHMTLGGFLFRFLSFFILGIPPSCSFLFTGFRTVFVFALGPFLPMVVNFLAP